MVELYYLPLNDHGFDLDLEDAVDVLDKTELGRYERFKNSHARDCFLQARRIVKTELAEKLDCQPPEVRFEYTDTEKPFLPNSKQWHFNISHSNSTIIVAIAEISIGIDVEDVDRCAKIWHRAEDFLNPYVKQCINLANSETESAEIFAEHWTCTESYIKLKGSAIYREKDRVQARLQSKFVGGKRYAFEQSYFTVFDFSKISRISVATENDWEKLKLTYWRTGEERYYIPN